MKLPALSCKVFQRRRIKPFSNGDSLVYSIKRFALHYATLTHQKGFWKAAIRNLNQGASLDVLMVIDGQGGGIGRAIIKRLRESLNNEVDILALGTNSVATAQMMKAGANRGATGENAIVTMAPQADIIIGPVAIIMANSMMGEVTGEIAKAVSSSKALKILIPLTQEKIKIVGVSSEPLPHLIDQVLQIITGGKKDV